MPGEIETCQCVRVCVCVRACVRACVEGGAVSTGVLCISALIEVCICPGRNINLRSGS